MDSEDLPNQHCFTEVSRMRRVYLQLFQRKLISAGCSFIDYSRFRIVLGKTKKFADLLVRFLEI